MSPIVSNSMFKVPLAATVKLRYLDIIMKKKNILIQPCCKKNKQKANN